MAVPLGEGAAMVQDSHIDPIGINRRYTAPGSSLMISAAD
jgi:hypothetical protein